MMLKILNLQNKIAVLITIIKPNVLPNGKKISTNLMIIIRSLNKLKLKKIEY